MSERRSAGLPLSVGRASIGVRLTIALVVLVTAAFCIAGGLLISRVALAARAVAVFLIVPLGLIGVIGTAFVLAPRSRFGVWLDHFVPRLREGRVAAAVAIALWAVAYLVTAR